jgi:hypothetical protein
MKYILKSTLQQIAVNDKTCFHNVYDKTFTMRKNVKNGRLEIQFLLQQTTHVIRLSTRSRGPQKKFFLRTLVELEN